MGEYWFTTLSAVRRGAPDWDAVAAYEPPIRRFLDERYRWVAPADREDLLQEILVAMHGRLVAGYDAAKGPFRPFLRTAIANRVRDHLRRRRAAARTGGALGDSALDEAAAAQDVCDDVASEEDAAAIDFEADIVRAVRSFHDLRVAGAKRDRGAVYVLSGALVDGLTNQEIAAREGLSADQVKRVLQAAREEVLAEVMARLLEGAGAGPEGAAPPDGAGAAAGADAASRAADLARACLREPRRERRLLDDEPDARIRGAVAGFLVRLRLLGAGASAPSSVDLVRGVRAVFESP